MQPVTPIVDPAAEFDALLTSAAEVPTQPASNDSSSEATSPDLTEHEALAFFLQGRDPAVAATLRPELLSPVAADLLNRLRTARLEGLELRPSILGLSGASLSLFHAVSQVTPIAPATFSHHLGVLRDRHRDRSLFAIYALLRSQVEPAPGTVQPIPVDAALPAAMRQLEDVVRAHTRDRDPTLAGYDYLSEYRRRPERRPTRFRELNRVMIGGFYAGSMFLLSGEAGAGKTAFILNLGADYARDGHRVVFFSLEMEAYEIASRLLTYLARDNIGLSALVNRKVSEAALASTLAENRPVFSNFIVEQMLAETSIHDLASTIYAHHISRPPDSKELVVIIDPFQRLNAGDPQIDRDDITRTRAIAKGIKALTNRLGCITLCTSDTTKEGMARGGQAAIRGSYEAVHIATTTAHLELDEEQPDEVERRNLTFSITKNRGGLPKGQLSLSFQGETQRFHEIERE